MAVSPTAWLSCAECAAVKDAAMLRWLNAALTPIEAVDKKKERRKAVCSPPQVEIVGFNYAALFVWREFRVLLLLLLLGGAKHFRSGSDGSIPNQLNMRTLQSHSNRNKIN